MASKTKPAAARRILSLSEESYDFLLDVILPGPGPDVTAAQMDSGYAKLRADIREVSPPAPLVCEGEGPHLGDVSKLVPYSSDGNMILCRACFNREMDERKEFNLTRNTDNSEALSIPTWASLKPYNP